MKKIKSILLNIFLFVVVAIACFMKIDNVNADSFPDTGGRVQYFYNASTKELKIRGQNAPTEHAYVDGNFTAASQWPWHSLRNQIEKVTFTTGTNGAGVGFAGVANFMFADMPNLKEVDLSGMAEIKASGLARMFSNCPKLEKIDMSMLTTDGNLNNIQNMFRNSGVKEVIMPSGEKFTLRDDAQLNGMFQDTKNLESFTWGDVDVTKAKSFTDMFKGSNVKDLDISGFGKLTRVVDMQDMLKECTNLETLNISNLDNSIIGPTNNRHSLKSGESGYISDREEAAKVGAKEFKRELGLETCTNLKTMDATNSKVWMVFNNRGLPGSEYFDAANEGNTYFFTRNQFSINGISIIDERDYIDVITDRESNNMYTFVGTNQMADKSTNVNEINNLNTNGSGFLAPGLYSISNTPFEKPKPIERLDSYYAIHYIGKVRPEVELIDDHNGDIVLTMGNENLHYLTTREMSKDEWGTGNKTIPFKAVITYPDAAIDVNGKKHDLIIEIKSVTFTDLNKFQSYSDYNGNRNHDQNNYWDSLKVDRDAGYSNEYYFYRPILQATKDNGIIFQNYARVGDPSAPWDYTQILTGGAGTTIEYDIKIDKANPDTTFVFYVNDLDVSASQNWVKPSPDADYDNLPIENVTYGLGGESVELVSGAKISDVKFADKTGLTISGNKIIATGPDPSTSWSEFKVPAKADGDGSSFKWISGISCNSYMLQNTDPMPLSNIELEPVQKVLDGGTLQDGQFEFVLTPDTSVENNKATGSPITKTNDANGYVDFGFVFDEPKITIDEYNYYPGTNDANTQDQNTHGNGTHNQSVYAWTIEEIKGSDSLIKYDTGVKKLKIIISTPENDAEAKKGIKAEVYVDGVLNKTFWSKDLAQNKHVGGIVFNNIQLKEVTLKNTWKDFDDKLGLRPNELPGTLTYKTSDGETITLTVEDGAWTKDDDTWTTKFVIPASATVNNWGEKAVPDNYEFTKGPGKDDVYEIINEIKKFDLTINKEVTGSGSDKLQEFNINVKIYDKDKKLVTDKFTVVINGEAQEVTSAGSGFNLKLKHGYTAVIKDLLAGYSYEVTEEKTDYTEYYSIVDKDGKTIVENEKGAKVTGEIKEDIKVTFINEKEKTPETPSNDLEIPSSNPEIPSNDPETPSNDSKIPNTGDSINTHIWCLFISLIGLVLSILYLVKNKIKKSCNI